MVEYENFLKESAEYVRDTIRADVTLMGTILGVGTTNAHNNVFVGRPEDQKDNWPNPRILVDSVDGNDNTIGENPDGVGSPEKQLLVTFWTSSKKEDQLVQTGWSLPYEVMDRLKVLFANTSMPYTQGHARVLFSNGPITPDPDKDNTTQGQCTLNIEAIGA